MPKSVGTAGATGRSPLQRWNHIGKIIFSAAPTLTGYAKLFSYIVFHSRTTGELIWKPKMHQKSWQPVLRTGPHRGELTGFFQHSTGPLAGG